MYKQVETDKPFVDGKGRHIEPVATLADQWGGRVQVTEDDHCIRCYLAVHRGDNPECTYYEDICYLFPELLNFLKTWPTPQYA